MKLSEAFELYQPHGSIGQPSLIEDYFELGTSEFREVISEKRIRELSEVYKTNYQTLKEDDFNIPSRANFGFSLVFSENDFIKAERNIPQGLEVFAESRRVEVLREDGMIDFADLIVSVW